MGDGGGVMGIVAVSLLGHGPTTVGYLHLLAITLSEPADTTFFCEAAVGSCWIRMAGSG